MRFLNTILNIIFPTKCISCGQADVDLCVKCLSKTPSAERENPEWIYSLYDYRHPPIKKALQLFKYNGKKRLANIFTEILYEKIIEELSELSVMENFHEPLLIPIPLSAKRYHERGYNQAELICIELIKIDNLRHPPRLGEAGGVNVENKFSLEKNILIKPKETEHQARIKNRTERLKNIIGSFAIKNGSENLIKKRNIILIDDITTTGATLTEARKVLKQAGARKIIAFTIAH